MTVASFARRHTASGLVVAAGLLLAACSTGVSPGGPPEVANVSFIGTPNETRIGPVDPHREEITVQLGKRAVLAAFRASECGAPAPDFTRFITVQARNGLRVPDGITLYDAGVASYRSKRCKATVPARAIGVYASRVGTYTVGFFGGKTKRTARIVP